MRRADPSEAETQQLRERLRAYVDKMEPCTLRLVLSFVVELLS